MQATHEGAHRRAGDGDDVVAPLDEDLDDTDVGVTARPSTTQSQGNTGGP